MRKWLRYGGHILLWILILVELFLWSYDVNSILITGLLVVIVALAVILVHPK